MTRPSDRPEDPWLRIFHRTPDAHLRLVCCPHAGGSASFFFPLSGVLARSGVEVLAIQYPGRQDRAHEPAEPSLQAVAERLAEHVAAPHDPWCGPDLSDRPLAVLGHSMGATVGYELCRLLTGTATEPVHLIASGQRSPELQSQHPQRFLDDDALIAEMQMLGGTASSMLADPDILAMVLPPMRGDFAALCSYRHRVGSRLRCPVTALAGTHDPKAPPGDTTGWADVTDGPFRLRTFDDGHFFPETMRADFAATLADLLEPVPAAPRPAGHRQP